MKKKKVYKEGDTTKALCLNCGFEPVDVTFKIRDVPTSDNLNLVKDILVGCCNGCDSVIVIPPQSTESIKNQLNK